MKRYLWLIPFVWLWSWGAYNAESSYWIDCEFSVKHYRQNLAMSAGYSLLPPAWVLSPFLTGFYEHGWSLSKRECDAESK